MPRGWYFLKIGGAFVDENGVRIREGDVVEHIANGLAWTRIAQARSAVRRLPLRFQSYIVFVELKLRTTRCE